MNYGLTTFGQHLKKLCEIEGRSYIIGIQDGLDARNGDTFQYIEADDGLRASWENRPYSPSYDSSGKRLKWSIWDYAPDLVHGVLYQEEVIGFADEIIVLPDKEENAGWLDSRKEK